MKKITVLFLMINFIFSQYGGSDLVKDKFELGDAIYRAGGVDHGHSGVFTGFFVDGAYFKMQYNQTNGYNNDDHKTLNDLYSISSPDTKGVFDKLVTDFQDGGQTYLGAMQSSNMTPEARNNIASEACNIFNHNPGYTWEDMLDPFNSWSWWPPGYYNTWDGTIGDIDEVRCDAYIEYPYEKTGLSVSGYRNLSSPGYYSNVVPHNDLHQFTGSSSGELCPMIQGNFDWESHGGDPGMYSSMQPSVVQKPIVYTPTVQAKTVTKWKRITHSYEDCDPVIHIVEPTSKAESASLAPPCETYSYYTYEADGTTAGVQLSFNVSDNASVKAFILIQAKLSGENTWYTLRYGAEHWEFNEKALTDWYGGKQTGYIFVPWDGQTKNGTRTFSQSQMLQCEYRIIAIDQGGNVSDEYIKPSPPANPTSLVASYSSGTSMGFAWTDNANNETNYQFQYQKSGGNWTTVTLPANTNSYTLTISSTGTYNARVRAKKQANSETVYSSYTNTTSTLVPSFATLTGPNTLSGKLEGTWSVTPTNAQDYDWYATVTSYVQIGTRKWVDGDGIIHYDPIYETRTRNLQSLNSGTSYYFRAENDDIRINIKVNLTKNGITDVKSTMCWIENGDGPLPLLLNTAGTYMDQTPREFRLLQNYPNPFNPTTTIKYALPKATNVNIVIYNSLGQIVKTFNEGYKLIGHHEINWDASQVASGIYFYQMIAGAVIERKRMVLMK